MKLDVPKIDPAVTLRTYRDNYTNLYSLWTHVTGVPDGVELKTPKEHPIEKLHLPSGIRDAMAEYERSHPKTPLTPIKYMRLVNGAPVLVVEDERPLPDESDLVTFSHTVSTTSVDAVSVVTDQLITTTNPDSTAVP